MKNKIIIHCADTYSRMDIGAHEIDVWHRERGWSAIGYAFVIRRDGSLELGRDLDGDWNVIEEQGAHAAGFNKEGIGVCIVGGKAADGKAEDNFTQPQKTTLFSLIQTIKAYQPEIEVLGHRDLPGVTKACPCFDVRSWLTEMEKKK